MKNARTRGSVVMVTALWGIAGCSSTSEPLQAPIKVVVQAPSAVTIAEPVPITIRVMNTSANAEVLHVPYDSTYRFDVVVRDSKGSVVWDRLANAFIATPLVSMTIEPGGEKDFATVWDGRNQSGTPVPAGSYSITGTFTPDTGPISADGGPLILMVVAR